MEVRHHISHFYGNETYVSLFINVNVRPYVEYTYMLFSKKSEERIIDA